MLAISVHAISPATHRAPTSWQTVPLADQWSASLQQRPPFRLQTPPSELRQ
jgi:hypothetical protein